MRLLKLVAINVVIFVVLAELAALFIFYERTGRLFYTYRPSIPLIEETARGALTGDALHPYFGPIHRTGVRAETNNIGFGSPHSYPVARAHAGQLLVGVFGGSVARQFCDSGAPRLVAALRRNAAYADRDIVTLCLAHEGYKQPQQALVLAYFLSIGQELDLAINIDGFNEVALGTYNHDRGRDVSMPSPIHLDPLVNLIDRSTMTPDMVQSLAAIERDKRRLNDLAQRIAATPLAFPAFVMEQYRRWTEAHYQAELARFAELPQNPPSASLVQVTPPLKRRTAETLYDDIAAQWVAASALMNDMLEARSAAYVHVLQPNQYFTRRRFGAEEGRVAINASTPFKPPVERGYPALQRAAAVLRGREHFVDATGIFDDEPAAVYADDCCHYTQRGNELLADVIAARVLEAVPSPPAARSAAAAPAAAVR
jgi:hypothetical protein